MKITFLSLLLFFSFSTYAHEDLIISLNNRNIHFQYKSGWSEFEVGRKVNILINLTSKLSKTKGYQNEFYLYFSHDYTKRDSSYYALGYGEFSFWDNNKNNPLARKNTTGLKVFIRDRDINIKQLLNLVNSAFENENYIKANQKKFIINMHFLTNGITEFDTLFSIPMPQLKRYFSSSDTIVENLNLEKIYRYNKKTEGFRVIDYYYQNYKFHIYNTRDPDEEWSEEQNKYIVSKTYGEDILVVENIHEILGNSNEGHFVFINDSIFYYIPQLKDNIYGPYEIENAHSGRRPIQKYYYEQFPVRRFTLFISNRGVLSKALFLPDKNLVISNFDKIENDFINGIFKKQTINQKCSESNLILNSILSILIISIILNLWLWSKNRKSS
jgi:hypothetical protein